MRSRISAVTYISFLTLSCLLISGCSSPTATGKPESETATDNAISVAVPFSGQGEAVGAVVIEEDTMPPINPNLETVQIEAQLADYDGLLEHVRDRLGKVVVVDIWSNSCIPCVREFPHLVELSRKWPDQVVCIALNVDFIGIKSKPAESYLAKINEFLTRQQANFLNLASSEADTDVFEKAGIAAIPAILLFDQSGKLVEKLTADSGGEDGLSYAGDVIPSVAALIDAPLVQGARPNSGVHQ